MSMLHVWWGTRGIIRYELLPPVKTINPNLYCQQLLEQMTGSCVVVGGGGPRGSGVGERVAILMRRLKVVICGFPMGLAHAIWNARRNHSLKETILCDMGRAVDIAPSNYHLFRSTAHALSEQRFTSYEDTKNWVDSWIASKDNEFFRLGIQTLPERWKKVASDGQYFD
ncbi:Mariner Mos1 transposase [Eumeta japonica]|uniref:Mariner Mos1 transposase n=1 Tax=Eumeta variegata TaxID=151549 RepID=A0A4C1VI62_EUMVA|nr:Mariner Mos1 transposase [Eumeta japonica]